MEVRVLFFFWGCWPNHPKRKREENFHWIIELVKVVLKRMWLHVKMCIYAIRVRAECHKQGGRGKVFIRCGCCILNKCGLNVVVGRNDGI